MTRYRMVNTICTVMSNVRARVAKMFRHARQLVEHLLMNMLDPFVVSIYILFVRIILMPYLE